MDNMYTTHDRWSAPCLLTKSVSCSCVSYDERYLWEWPNVSNEPCVLWDHSS